ncbi:hypothetical protein QBC35DRAFT_141259 [Podospora australis]|uniref:Uncharacterized protein n=1 Tax=Podospora australis TaxID=1536484 RepID=A0AAN6WY64_9PEZI|nr:hypothetical protein QBC35DRAFT_141259 [Podospora australis]
MKMDHVAGVRTVPLAVYPPSRSTHTSIFSPVYKECCQCTASLPLDSNNTCSCSHTSCLYCQNYDSRGEKIYHGINTPTHWMCYTCHSTHSVLELLVDTEIECECDSPTLWVVYDNWGYPLLSERSPESHKETDLRHLSNIREAARKCWMLGADRWADEVQRVQIERARITTAVKEDLFSVKAKDGDEVIRDKMMLGRHNRAWSAISASSMSSEDSLDRELVEMGLMEA